MCVCVCVWGWMLPLRWKGQQWSRRKRDGRQGGSWASRATPFSPSPFPTIHLPTCWKSLRLFFTNMWNTFNHLSCAHPSCLHPPFSHSFPPILNALAFYAYGFTAFAVLCSCVWLKKQYVIVFALCKALINQKKGHWALGFLGFFKTRNLNTLSLCLRWCSQSDKVFSVEACYYEPRRWSIHVETVNSERWCCQSNCWKHLRCATGLWSFDVGDVKASLAPMGLLFYLYTIRYIRGGPLCFFFIGWNRQIKYLKLNRPTFIFKIY